MIGMVTSCTGKQTLLPALLQWNIKRTDGEPCDSFSVQFLCGKTTKELLEQATEFRATEKGRVVFTGIVDDFELRLGKEGAIAELTGRLRGRNCPQPLHSGKHGCHRPYSPERRAPSHAG